MKSNLTYLKKPELYKQLDSYKGAQFFAMIDLKVKVHLPEWVTASENVFWLSDPEGQKSIGAYQEALEFFLARGLLRTSVLFGIGGGATTDLCGFVASTILRGVDWVAVPTTLLAMVDGSIGGKVALNLKLGKNLVGAFHLPREIFICYEFLSTLPPREWLSGKGEVLKYGFLSQRVHALIMQKAPLQEIALECARFKEQVVEKDFLEKGDRILLNLGHTLGHAFEHQLKIPHGHGVLLGMKYLFSVLGMGEQLATLLQMAEALSVEQKSFEVKSFSGFSLNTFLELLDHDKKKSQSALRLVLVKGIGSCYVEEVSMKDFKEKISSHDDFKDR
ncbi:MAG TPA: 3-dehydroquinate synthase family protein [Bacteriovoracaceae bacterium]|nr:3-dehydroquinate synthase family protein [Bacteriovoracaceae bacterium]